MVARLEGTDPARKKEHIIYTAHWDHLGRDASLTGDQIFNGAADNASGVAAVLGIAKAFAQVQPPPKRSILFLAVTAEEQGLLGAKYYAEHPLYPLESTLADINMDVINLWGRTRDITSVGLGQSNLDDLLRELAQTQGRVVIPDAEPGEGLFYRSDHFEFAKQGVPALNAKAGVSYVGKPGGLRPAQTRGVHAKRLSQGQRPGEAGLGPLRCHRRPATFVGRRPTPRRRGPIPRVERRGSEFRERRETMLKKYQP